MDFVINEVNYALPARTFAIDYSVSQKRQLPVVKEFVIRFIFSIEKCLPETIREFFGFTPLEMTSVLSELEEEKLVRWIDQEICLTDYAHGRFAEAGGGNTPRFYETKDEVDMVSFDLMQYRLITEKLSGKSSFANIELELDPECFSDITGKVKSAFDKQFNDFLEKAKKVDTYSEHRELYKINSVTSQYDRMLPVRVNWVVDASDSLDPTPMFADEILYDWDDDGAIIGAIAHLLSSEAGVPPSNVKEVMSYLKATFDPYVDRFYGKDGIDISALLSAYEVNKGLIDANTRMLVGNLYTTDNRRRIEELLRLESESNGKCDAKGALWLSCPDNKTWGRGNDLHELEDLINKRIDSRYKPGRVVHCMQADSFREANNLKSIYHRPGMQFQGVSKAFVSQNVEILLVPDFFVATLFHLTPPGWGKLTVPVGYMSCDDKYVKAVQSSVRAWADDEANFNSYYIQGGNRNQKFSRELIDKVLS
ncbi:hypothetical protein [Pseudohalioglobus lutimaris]|uniref:Uncharacterized protein n=1 Tax=Pseudohalioglobus lutimaris TaxID=1737061 RepID=A0A2N5WXF1_9GAMM|nr:hypothetical protein [Pseudohalioglobus lutimaris]PLW66906.1 hypothetical protein C0039_19420 [Pseudohalioglobus lutimaris]